MTHGKVKQKYCAAKLSHVLPLFMHQSKACFKKKKRQNANNYFL